MGRLVITCPATGNQLDTGIETDQASIDLAPAFIGRANCPHCGTEHLFTKEHVLVCELVDGVIRYSRAA